MHPLRIIYVKPSYVKRHELKILTKAERNILDGIETKIMIKNRLMFLRINNIKLFMSVHSFLNL